MANESKKDIMFDRMRKKKEEVKVVRKIVTLIVLVVLVVIGIGGYMAYNYISSATKAYDPDDDTIIEVEIPIGSGLDTISTILEKEKVIKSAKLFKYYAKFNNESSFQAGTYDLSKSMTPDELIKSLKSGKVYRKPLFTVTVREGLNLAEIAKVFEKELSIKSEDFLSYVNDKEQIQVFMEKYPELIGDEVLAKDVKYPLEGYLFPATYPFYEENPSVEEVVDMMLEQTNQQIEAFKPYLEEQDRSVHWLLTFASLLEKEATAQADRETIASVFFNRIDADMPLQTDPTVAYAHGKHLDRTYYKDLEIDDPYNTYKIKGIPPGPIAAPGLSSIEATVDPSDSDYLYFLADKEGTNHFSVTYEEHLEKRAKYIDE